MLSNIRRTWTMENRSLRRHTTLHVAFAMASWMPSWTTSLSSTVMGNCVQLMKICRRHVSSTTCHSGSGDLHPVARRSVLACRDATQLAVSAAGRLRPVPCRSDPRAVLRISPATLPGKALFQLRRSTLCSGQQCLPLASAVLEAARESQRKRECEFDI